MIFTRGVDKWRKTLTKQADYLVDVLTRPCYHVLGIKASLAFNLVDPHCGAD